MKSLENSNSTERILDARELEKLIFLSFMHSQGSQELHPLLTKWIGSYYGEQDETVFNTAVKSFFDSKFDEGDTGKFLLANKFLHTPNFSDQIDPNLPGAEPIVKIEAEQELEYVYPLLGLSSTVKIDAAFYESVLDEMLDRDATYLKQGRPNRQPNATNATISGKYFSFVKKYMIDDDTTSDSALDDLYKKVRTILCERLEISDPAAVQWKEIFLQRHPGTTINC